MTTEAWAAIAAFFSAAAAWGVLLIHRSNRIDAARPEIVLEGWSRDSENPTDQTEILRFRTVRNVGKGGARMVRISIPVADLPIFLGGMTVEFLGPDGAVDGGEIRVWWSNAKPIAPGGRFRFATLEIQIVCWDALGYRYTTTQSLRIEELGPSGIGARQMGGDYPVGFLPGTRSTVRHSVRLLKLARFGRKLREPRPWDG